MIWLGNTRAMVRWPRILEKYYLKLLTICLVFMFSVCRFFWECFLISWCVSLKRLLTIIWLNIAPANTVSKIRKRLNNTLISCYSETGGKLMRYLNLVLSSEALEWIFITYRSGIDYNNETFEILNLKWRYFVVI